MASLLLCCFVKCDLSGVVEFLEELSGLGKTFRINLTLLRGLHVIISYILFLLD